MSTKLRKLLTRSNSEITETRAERISRSVENAFKARLMDTQSKIDVLNDKKERMMDMSASNNTTTKNAIDDLNATGFVDKYCEIDEELFILNRQMTIQKNAYKELFEEDADLSMDATLNAGEESSDA
jgi:hypothetical protein